MIYVALILSFFQFVLIGVGYLVIRFGHLEDEFDSVNWRMLAASATSGLALFYITGLIFGSLKLSWLMSIILSLIGYYFLIRRIRKRKLKFHLGLFNIIGAGLVLTLFGAVALDRVLTDWDGLYGYFLHSKILFGAGGFGTAEDWNSNYLGSYAFDYPKLLPYLGAQTAFLISGWNYVAPNSSVLLLTALSILGSFSIGRNLFERILLVLFSIMLCSHYNWNWYMDAHFSVFATLGFGHLLLAYKEKKRHLILISSVYFGLTLGLKAEGVFWMASLGAGLFVFWVLEPGNNIDLKSIIKDRLFWICSFLLLAGFILWKARCSIYGLESHFFSKGIDYNIQVFTSNWTEGKHLKLLLPAILNEHAVISLIRLSPIIFLMTFSGVRLSFFIAFSVSVVIYIFFMFVIFMSSTNSLESLIGLSLGRVLWVIDAHANFFMFLVISNFVGQMFLQCQAMFARMKANLHWRTINQE